MEVVEDLRVDEERDIEYDGSRERGRPVGLLPGDDEGEREEEKQEEHEAEEAEMTDEAYYGVEMIERAHRSLRRLDEVSEADGRGEGDVEESEPLRPFHR